MTVESLLAELEPVEDAQVAPGVGTYRYYDSIKTIDTFFIICINQMSGQYHQPPAPGQGVPGVLQAALGPLALLLDRDGVLAGAGAGSEGGDQSGLAAEGVQQGRVQTLRQRQGGGLRVSDEQETCVRRQENDVRWIRTEK